MEIRPRLPAPAGCSSPQGEYFTVICYDGSWAINRLAFPSFKFTTLREGNVPAAAAYTLTAIARGDSQSIGVNGSILATVSDSLSISGYIDLDIYDPGTDPTTLIFTDFSYTPLP